MSSDTAAPSGTAAGSPRPSAPESVPRQAEPVSGRTARVDREPPGRHEPPADRSGMAWSIVTVAAAVAFCAALVFGATHLFVEDVEDVTDSPERSVSSFLGALLDDRDADAAAEWLCTDKADRDLSEAVAALAAAEDGGPEWGDVSETDRSVGTATVRAEVRMTGSASPATWEFSLVAEEGDPQWLICGIAAA